MKKAILIPTISLFIICLVSTIFLGVVNEITEDKIAQNAVITEAESQKKVMPDADSFGEKQEGSYTYDGTSSAYSYVPALDKDKKTIG